LAVVDDPARFVDLVAADVEREERAGVTAARVVKLPTLMAAGSETADPEAGTEVIAPFDTTTSGTAALTVVAPSAALV
jgi:hypothetical protein